MTEDLMTEETHEFPDAIKWILDTFKGSGVITDRNDKVCGDVVETKISLVGTEGWDQLDFNDNLTVKDIIPDYVIQEIDIYDLLERYIKLVGLEQFFQHFPNRQNSEDR